MAKNEAHDNIVQSLASSSPLLSEVAALLTQTSLPTLGLPITDAAREVQAHSVRTEGVALADLVTGHAKVVSNAAPDLALAAPDFAVSAY
jgi:hypothetical protein